MGKLEDIKEEEELIQRSNKYNLNNVEKDLQESEKVLRQIQKQFLQEEVNSQSEKESLEGQIEQ